MYAAKKMIAIITASAILLSFSLPELAFGEAKCSLYAKSKSSYETDTIDNGGDLGVFKDGSKSLGLDFQKTITTPSTKFPTNDRLYSKQWHIQKIDMDDAWEFINERFPEKEKVKVAVLDMGTNLDHEDLEANIIRENCVEVPRMQAGQLPNPDDEIELKPYTEPLQYHGSFVSGVIAANSNNGKGVMGMTNNLVDLMSINVFRYRKSEADRDRLATSKDIAKCVEYAVENGAKVINMSIGNSYGSQSQVPEDQTLEKTLNWAVKEKNVTVVCSAGNSSSSSRAHFPSDFDSTISVISTDNYRSAFDKCKSSFSNYGSKKTLSAPGRKIPTTNWNKNDSTYSCPSGTSMAAPVVSSVAALMYYVNPDISSKEVRDILCSTATDLYKPGWDAYTGYGNVNAYAAVAKAAGVDVKNDPAPLKTPRISAVLSAGLGKLSIKWSAVPNAEEYYLYRAESPKGTYRYVNRTSNAYYTNGNLKYGKRYYYRVKAIGTVDNKKARSDMSSYRSNYPNGKVPSVSASNQTYNSIRVTWKRVSDATGYKIYRASTKNGTYKNVKRIKKGVTTSWRDTKRIPGKRYYYKVRAYKPGVNGTISGKVSAKALPSKTNIRLSKYKSTAVRVKWTGVSSVTGYKIYRAASKTGKYKLIATKKSSSRSYIARSLKKGKKYYFKIKAYKKVGKKIINGYSSTAKTIKL